MAWTVLIVFSFFLASGFGFWTAKKEADKPKEETAQPAQAPQAPAPAGQEEPQAQGGDKAYMDVTSGEAREGEWRRLTGEEEEEMKKKVEDLQGDMEVVKQVQSGVQGAPNVPDLAGVPRGGGARIAGVGRIPSGGYGGWRGGGGGGGAPAIPQTDAVEQAQSAVNTPDVSSALPSKGALEGAKTGQSLKELQMTLEKIKEEQERIRKEQERIRSERERLEKEAKTEPAPAEKSE
jgi:hypothetical protein